MNTSHTAKGIATLSAGLALAAIIGAGAGAPAAYADEVIAADTSLSGTMVGTHVPTARADKPRQVIVTNHDGRSVALFAKGERIRRILAPGQRPAVFRDLTAGRIYTVAVGGEPIGTVIALDAPLAASGLTVRSTSTPGAVFLTWRHRATTGTGGRLISYDVAARSRTAPPVTSTVTGTRQATLTGLDPSAVYTFSVTPRNSAGSGRATAAAMGRPLSTSAAAEPETPTATVPVTETPKPALPITPPAAAPAPGPATRTILRCPTGFTELASGLCQKAVPYTFTTKEYTFTWGVVGSHSVPDAYAANVGPLAQGPTCPWGGTYDGGGLCVGATSHSVNDYGWIKDATPVGFTDDGTQWSKKDPNPVGYTDDGTQWVQVAPMESVVVPA